MISAAPMLRTVGCTSGGMSGSASFTATWLKPQHRHTNTITAAAPKSSGRVAAVWGAWMVAVMSDFPAGEDWLQSGSDCAAMPEVGGWHSGHSKLRSFPRKRESREACASTPGSPLSRGRTDISSAIRADAGDLDHRRFRRKARGTGGALERFRNLLRGRLAYFAAALADQEYHEIVGAVTVRTSDEGIAA